MINLDLVKKELHDQRWLITLGILILISMGLLMAFSFDWITVQIDSLQIKKIIAPQWIKKTFDTIPQLKDYTYALWSNWNPKNLIQIGTIMAVLLGTLTFAGEIEHRTITFLLSNRLTRQAIFRSKVVAAIISLGLIFMLPSALLPLFSAWAGHSLTSLRIIGASFVTFLGGLCILSLAILVAISVQDRIKTLLTMFVILILQIVIQFIPVVNKLSIFNYINAPAYYFEVMSFPWFTALVLILISGLLLTVSEYYFKTTDF